MKTAMKTLPHKALRLPRPTNPFSSRSVAPGAIPFFFREGQSLSGLITAFETAGRRGQIVGQHGTGKSTLLAALLPALENQGYRVQSVTLHDGQRRLTKDFLERDDQQRTPGSKTILSIDGYEQLARLERWRINRFCRRQGWGLLVAVHATVGLPTLYETEVSDALAIDIVHHLLRNRTFEISTSEIAQSLIQQQGNLRELLFDLYDRYERVR